MSSAYLLAIDQGTTSTRAMVFDADGNAVSIAQQELPQVFPRPGWVEHDPNGIWRDTQAVLRAALERAELGPEQIAGIGITNQRETTVLWERATGRPLHNAIVWQDRRTSEQCARLRADGLEAEISQKTGLLLDPYFSATKIAWLLDNVDSARSRAEAGELAFGTIDSYLVWRLTGGSRHVTDATNASRTLLYDIRAQAWDSDLLRIFGVPRALLPEVLDNAAEFGHTAAEILGAPVPIRGAAGDQQAAAIGQACLVPGTIKSTYGTGCFALLNTGDTPLVSRNRLLTTTAYRFAGKPHYALEGSIFSAGATIQWLRDGLGLIENAAETAALARAADPASGVYLVPAFAGLGAPYWDSEARGALYGLTRDSGRAEIARAALEAIGFQTRDLLDAMVADGAAPPAALRVDGGLAQNDWAMGFVADILDLPVERSAIVETTALGAAYLAGLQAGLYADISEMAENWACDMRFESSMKEQDRSQRYAGWLDAVARTRTNGG